MARLLPPVQMMAGFMPPPTPDGPYWCTPSRLQGEEKTMPTLAQGLCPMCAGMGISMVLVWVLVLAMIAGLVWLVVRRTRR